jgi:protein-S-isoprenylcysteine O-methyltransferase Ste14
MLNRNAGEYLPAILNLVSGGGVLLISFFVEPRIPMSKEIAKPLGLLIVLAGMALVAWAAVHIKRAFLGEVQPRLDVIIQDGPYRMVRHPVYLGMTIALLGAAVSLRSWPGMMAVLLLFLPSEIYRARLEERALSAKFGGEWLKYAARTSFILPLVRSER